MAIIIIPEIEIEFNSESDASSMETYLEGLKICSMLTERKGSFMLNIYDVTEEQLGWIRRKHAIESFSRTTVKVIDNAKDAIVSAADFASYKVVAPIAQASIKAGLGIGKVLTKSVVATGSTVIGSSIENTRKVYNELKVDTEMLKAKQELKSAYSSITSFFGFSGSTVVKIVGAKK